VRSSTRRTILWALALVAALVAVGVAFMQSGGDDQADEAEPPPSPSPHLPEDLADVCGDEATTEPADLSLDRTLARCGPGAPAAQPLPGAAAVRVAVTARSDASAPLLLADALGEFEAEGLQVEIVDMDGVAAYEAMAAGEVDAVVGGIDAPFFDAVHDGLAARLVMGGTVPRAPSDLDLAQAGLWLRSDLISDEEKWDNVEAQTILVPGGPGGAATYPINTILGQHQLGPNTVDIAEASPSEAASRLLGAEVGGAWVPGPFAGSLGEDPSLRLVVTVPGSESIDGTVFGPRLLRDDRDVGLAYVRAVVRTINTHVSDGYGDEVLPDLAAALDVDEDVLADGASPLFDWEVRSGTTTRIQEALVTLGSVGYEEPAPERGLVDRTLVDEAVAADE
jgi:NitT/TauT family transport system substrate-binding protein